MQITIIDVGQPNTHAAKNGRTYQSMEVTYKDEQGKVNNKKLMSFSNPSVFKTISTLNKGDSLNVKTEKDQNGYWQWTGILEEGEKQVAQQPAGGASSNTRVTGSNYETKEERAARQVMIVRQSSLSTAVASLAIGAKALAPSPADVIAYAKQLESYVMGQAQTLEELDSNLDEVGIE